MKMFKVTFKKTNKYVNKAKYDRPTLEQSFIFKRKSGLPSQIRPRPQMLLYLHTVG